MTDPNPFKPPGTDLGPLPDGPGTPPERQRWPRIFGIVSCAFAGASMFVMPLLLWFNKVNPDSKRFLELLPAWHETLTNYDMVLGLAFSAMLLVAGFKLMRQRRTARTLHLFYAWGSLLRVLVVTVILFYAWGQIDTDNLSRAMRFGLTAGKFGAFFGAVAGAAYPIFLMVWFSKERIKNDIEMWAED